MKKITILFLFFTSIFSFAQSKSTAIVSLSDEMTANFTLDNTTSKVTLVLTGPSNKWTSLGLGTSSSTTGGDVYVYTTSVINNTSNSNSPNEDWIAISNTVNSGKRTVTLERSLTNSDLNDLQMAFDTTNAIDVVWSRSGGAIATAPSSNRGSTRAVFSANLSVNDTSFENEVVIYPNPTSGELFIKTKTNLSKVSIYSETGALVKTIEGIDHANELKVNVNDLPKALYIFELQNDVEKTWKKVLVN
jgi:hypothetical protein